MQVFSFGNRNPVYSFQDQRSWNKQPVMAGNFISSTLLPVGSGGDRDMAEESARSDIQTSSDKDGVSRSSSDLKMVDSKDSISIKVICLGDSAVGKSK